MPNLLLTDAELGKVVAAWIKKTGFLFPRLGELKEAETIAPVIQKALALKIVAWLEAGGHYGLALDLRQEAGEK